MKRREWDKNNRPNKKEGFKKDGFKNEESKNEFRGSDNSNKFSGKKRDGGFDKDRTNKFTGDNRKFKGPKKDESGDLSSKSRFTKGSGFTKDSSSTRFNQQPGKDAKFGGGDDRRGGGNTNKFGGKSFGNRKDSKFSQRFDDRKDESKRGDRKDSNFSKENRFSSSKRSEGKKDYQNKDSYGKKENFGFQRKKSEPTPTYFLKTHQKQDLIRLNRYIANSGVCSRRDADDLILQGLIQVNGQVITELGYKVKYADEVKYNNRVLNREKPVYILLNKPKDFITTMDDPQERKTVMTLIEGACKERVYPVGRLDRNTTGLILLTNDGELAEKLTHPSNNIKKIYQVEIDKPITNDDFEKIADSGVVLEDGKVHVDDFALIGTTKTSLGIEIHEGRNRIVRRLFEHLGYTVVKLDRTMYAGLSKKDLPRGQYRFLTEKEVINLKFKK